MWTRLELTGEPSQNRKHGYKSTEVSLQSLAALAAVAEQGGFENLNSLHLHNNRIGDAGMIALSAALSGDVLRRLTLLRLSRNLISSDGIVALAGVCQRGALSELHELGLMNNKISDQGLNALAVAFRTALPSLAVLRLNGNPASAAAVKRLRSAAGKQGITAHF